MNWRDLPAWPVLATLMLLAAVLILAGCGEVRLPDSPSPDRSDPGSWLALVAEAGTALAGVVFVVLVVASVISVLQGNIARAAQFGKLIAACFAAAIACQALYWFGKNLALATILALVGVAICGGIWVWLHRRYVVGKAEETTGRDLDGDGKVG